MANISLGTMGARGHAAALMGAVLIAAVSAPIGATPMPVPPAAAEAAAPAEAPMTEAEFRTSMDKLAKSLHPQSGIVPIGPARAALNLGTDFYFLPADEARRVLTEAWGNSPDSVGDVLGIVFPKGKTFLDDTWGAVVTYEGTGYVSDADAKEVNYDELMTQMKAANVESNAAARAAGYPGGELTGWAQSPTYDAARHALIWARKIKFDGNNSETVNYDVRLLGRSGVLSLNIVDEIDDLKDVRDAATKLGTVATFEKGATYADFNEATDVKAEYGLAGLVAAGAGVAVAKKVGLLAIILKFGKFIVIGLIAGFAMMRNTIAGWFGRKPATDDIDYPPRDEN